MTLCDGCGEKNCWSCNPPKQLENIMTPPSPKHSIEEIKLCFIVHDNDKRTVWERLTAVPFVSRVVTRRTNTDTFRMETVIPIADFKPIMIVQIHNAANGIQ